jgi:hypothetical protein
MAIPLEEKVWFVRKLIEERAKRSLLGRVFRRDVSNMSVEEAMGSPEGTVVTIVDTYYELRANGASAAETQPPLTATPTSETQTRERGFFYRCAAPGNRGSARAERTRFGRVRRLRKQLADMC